ncbi:GTP-binding DUF697 domain-containing protein [Nesterenkonia massiliensis]|uniref:GTP-binding DUF697 domain-containing protein n=1 Tax=Nesterenkonia massiliensis TaxID=1232429 RepID=A0ABT2HSU0_9MICC|nr:GTP-binding DUF697 domain-containing protein [Nesterenkonia massiliensis]MCT1607762.1 GTP-binding DUF697 domain-containing protein [Nesterenkonia massiliensis]
MPKPTRSRNPKDSDLPDDRHFHEGTAAATARYGRFNLAVVGNTGVGKSSLVNAVFRRDFAKVGKGMPVTKGIDYYHDDSLGIWDFEGFEIGTSESPKATLRRHLEAIKGRPKDQQIDVVWYCVLHNADRLTGPDIQMIQELDAAELPVILVMTKVPWQKNPVTGKYRAPESTEIFKQWLEAPVDPNGEPIDLPLQHVALTSTQNSKGKGAGHGLGDLVEKTLELAPNSSRDSFRVAQQINLPWKREIARRQIAAASAAAGAAAATPLPVADAVTLAPIQLAMMGKISHIYGLELASMMSSTALAQLAAQLSGQALARSFVKLVPGIGSVVNATVATAITAAIGEGWVRLCETVHTGKVRPDEITDVLDQFGPTVVSVAKEWLRSKSPGATPQP